MEFYPPADDLHASQHHHYSPNRITQSGSYKNPHLLVPSYDHPKAQHSNTLQTKLAKTMWELLPGDTDVVRFDNLRTQVKSALGYNQVQYDHLAESMKEKLITVYKAHTDTLSTFSPTSSNTKEYPNHIKYIAHLRSLAKRLLVYEWKMNIT